MAEASNRTIHFRIFILSVVGVALSLYLALHHIEVNSNSNAAPSFCSISATFDCDAVARSQYSEIAGIPLANLGLAFYLWLTWLSFSSYMGRGKNIDSVVFFLASTGLLFSLFYLGVSLLALGTICLFCSMLYVCGITIFVLAIGLSRQTGMVGTFLNAIGASFSWFASLSSKELFLDILFLALSAFSVFRLPEILHSSFYPAEVKNSSSVDYTEESYKEWLASPLKKFNLNTSGPIAKRDFVRGASKPKVTLIEFSDLECPHCRNAASVFKSLIDKFPEQLRVVSRNFPLDSTCNKGMPPNVVKSSCRGARATRCAGEISEELYWKIHDELFKYPGWDSSLLDDLDKYFSEGEERSRFKICMESDYPVGVQRDISEADRVGLQSTPTVFINGKLVGSSDRKTLEGIISRIIETRGN